MPHGACLCFRYCGGADVTRFQELQLARRTFTGVEAEMATSPSCKSDEGLNAISEEDEDAEDDE